MDMNMENHDMQELEDRLREEGKDYRDIPVPEEMKGRVEAAAGRDSRIRRFRIPAVAAAAAAMLVLLPNTGADVAYAMGNIPVIGGFFQAVTFREYQYEGDRSKADAEVPRIVLEDLGEDMEEPEGAAAGETAQIQEELDRINFDIEETTGRLLEEFKASVEAGENAGSLEIHHETVTDNEKYFTLKISVFQAIGSSRESYKFYTIDKESGKQIQIGDLFRENSGYAEALSEDIRNQMREAMAEDEGNIYWVDNTDMPGMNWEGISEDQNFYFDEDGNLNIVFDEYEVAPGYMGAQEFKLERAVYEDLMK